MMKVKVVFQLFVVIVIGNLLSCSAPTDTAISSSEKGEPEFDGAYIWIEGDRFIQTDGITPRTGKITDHLMNYLNLVDHPLTHFVISPSFQHKISPKALDGFFLKGSYSFEFFSFHQLEEISIKGRQIYADTPQTRELALANPLHIAGKEISLQKKANESGTGYYFKFPDRLAAGNYVGWCENVFWVFSVTP